MGFNVAHTAKGSPMTACLIVRAQVPEAHLEICGGDPAPEVRALASDDALGAASARALLRQHDRTGAHRRLSLGLGLLDVAGAPGDGAE